MRKFEAIIFDMDGVLIDSEPFHYEIEQNQFKINNIIISENEHKEFLGISSEEMWKRIAMKKQLTERIEFYIVQNIKQSINFFAEMDVIKPMMGIIDVLGKLKNEGFHLAVASSSIPEIIEILLSKSDLIHYFDHLVSSKEAGRSKPFPDVYILAAKKLKVSPEKCLAIEDSDNGIKSAKAANMKVAEFNPSNHKKQKVADFTISDFSQIFEIIRTD